jgi:hypothetical protein
MQIKNDPARRSRLIAPQLTMAAGSGVLSLRFFGSLTVRDLSSVGHAFVEIVLDVL